MRRVAKAKALNQEDHERAIRRRRFMCDNLFDVRTFGAMMSTGVS
jgi:CRISPR-associated protein Csd2